MGENWLPVVGLEGWYEVSDTGRVRRIAAGKSTRAGRVLVGGLDSRGYRQVCLYRNGRRFSKMVHNLVAAAFIGPKPVGYEVNHIDNNTDNPAASNLEYVTHRQNIKHAGQRMARLGETHGLSKLTVDAVRAIRAAKRGSHALAAMHGITYATLKDVRRGKTWRHVV